MADRPFVLPKPAKRGTKRGWVHVSTELDPVEYTEVERALQVTHQRRTDYLRDAILSHTRRILGDLAA